MDEKKVREAIQYFRKMLFDMEKMGFKYTPKYYTTAIEALEKQLPKKVDAKENFRDFYGRLIYYKGFCPNCGFVMDSSKNNHCNACGQKLDWTVEE